MNIDEYKEITEYITRHQFQVVGFDEKSNKLTSIGTCVLLKIFSDSSGLNFRYFILTASHVLNIRHKLKNKEIFIFNYITGLNLKISTIGVVISDRRDVPDLQDIAIIEVNKEVDYSSIPEDNFLSIDIDKVVFDLNPSINSEEKIAYIVSGYPVSKNKLSNKDYNESKLKTIHFFFITNEYDSPDEVINSYIKNKVNIGGENAGEYFSIVKAISLCLDYRSELVGRGSKLPKETGMSGGGVWLLSNVSEDNPRLVSISVACRNNMVISIKMAFVLSIIKAFFSGTILDQLSLDVSIKREGDTYALLIPEHKCL